MKNLWPDFKFDNIETPKEILEEQGKLLLKLTNEIVYGEVLLKDKIELGFEENESSYTNYDYTEWDFIADFVLKSKFMLNYKFKLLTLNYNIVMYPFEVSLDDTVFKEIHTNLAKLGFLSGANESQIVVSDQEKFEKFLALVFSTNHVRNVINSLISLSK
jgi:hypothetical protein